MTNIINDIINDKNFRIICLYPAALFLFMMFGCIIINSIKEKENDIPNRISSEQKPLEQTINITTPEQKISVPSISNLPSNQTVTVNGDNTSIIINNYSSPKKD